MNKKRNKWEEYKNKSTLIRYREQEDCVVFLSPVMSPCTCTYMMYVKISSLYM